MFCELRDREFGEYVCGLGVRCRLEESDLVHIRKGGIQRRCREEQFCYTEECMLSKDVITRLANAGEDGRRH